MSQLNRSQSRPSFSDENGYEERPAPLGYSQPLLPQQARPPPQRQNSRPTMRTAQPHTQYEEQSSRQGFQRQPSRPDQQYSGPAPQQRLQRQPSRPDQQYSDPPLQQRLQRQPSQPSMPLDLPNPHLQQQFKEQPPLPLPSVEPAFVRPPFPQNESQTTLFSAVSRPYADNMLIRNNSDDVALLAKNDVFWRRFSASAAQQQDRDVEKSSWLEKNEGKSSAYSRRVWFIGLLLVLVSPSLLPLLNLALMTPTPAQLAGGGIGIGVYLSFHSSSNTRPDTLGGSAGFTSAGAAGTAVTTTGGATATSSSLHVSPTNTVP
ncbi:hypothetical protein B0H10DRAFT_2214863 [Mycena sp. CBHHK59/15]|nr:hypothetical protein B0H10DRAFT_2214863 [Mycena sp. CBHHK59/15]